MKHDLLPILAGAALAALPVFPACAQEQAAEEPPPLTLDGASIGDVLFGPTAFAGAGLGALAALGAGAATLLGAGATGTDGTTSTTATTSTTN